MSGKLGWFLLGGVCIAFGAVLLGSLIPFRNNGPAPIAGDSLTTHSSQSRQIPIDDGYVGSEACGKCHSQVLEAYRHHPMGRSLTTPLTATPIERTDISEFSPPGPRRYRIERTKDGVRHHELMVDQDGNVLYDQAVDVSYVLGSGKRGRGYLIEHDGMFFKSPIAWFSTTNEWGLSPGYPPDGHKRFERRITDGCINCHAGHLAVKREAADTFVKPVVIEASIGCERCHGPGKKHVELHKLAQDEAFDNEEIVNPARLDPARRDSICAECHLHGKATVLRTGQKVYDFKPGQLLEDNRIVFVTPPGKVNTSVTAALSQVEQMESSTCFIKSGGRMGCTSCHDPHRLPQPESKVEYYRGKCLACHETRGCGLPVKERLAREATDSCMACHMAPVLHVGNILHVSFSDHRILRQTDTPSAHKSTGSTDPADFAIYNHAEQRLPKLEVDRAIAFMLAGGTDGKSPTLAQARRAEQLLLPVHEAQPDDIDTLEVLAAVCLIQRRPEEAEHWWNEVLLRDPQRESVLQNIALYYHDRRQLEPAREYLQRYLVVNPWHGHIHGRLAGVLKLLGEPQAGIAAAERALELNPTLVPLHDWLAHVYEENGQPAESERHRKMHERMQQLLSKPNKSSPSDSSR